jgi:hypothetical protein
MNLKHSPARILLFGASLGLMLGTASTDGQERMSPDNRWEYQHSESIEPRIVRAGTDEVVLDLSDALPSKKNGWTVNQEAEPVWAPDSKRVAFNYAVHEHRSEGFGTIVMFELRDDKWIFLRSPLDSKEVREAQSAGPNDDNRDQLAKLAKTYLPRKSYSRVILKSPMSGDFLKVLKWTDSDTAVFWAFSADAKAGALCEMSVDAEGKWKLVNRRMLSGDAAEKQQGD